MYFNHSDLDAASPLFPPFTYSIEPTEGGDYKLCFDNSFSTISEKLVFFELIFDSAQEDEDLNHWAEVAEPEEILDIKIEDIKVGQKAG